MTKAKKKILFHFEGFTHFLHVTKRDNLADLRLLIDDKISTYMKPKGDWIFSVNSVKIEKQEEEDLMVYRDIVKEEARLELIEKAEPLLKRKSPPKEEEDSFEDSDFGPEEVPPDYKLEPPNENERKKSKCTDSVMVTPDKEPSNRGADTPAPTNSVEFLPPDRQPSDRNVAQEPGDAPSDQPKPVPGPNLDLTSVPIKDETRKKFAAERKESFAKYGDRYLLHRQHELGVRKLGGNMQETFPIPRHDTPGFQAKIQDYDFPMPLHVLFKGNSNRFDFGYACYNSLQQPNGPMFAGQKSASVGAWDSYFEETGYPFPVFMKRTLTTLQRETEGPLLGWEYVGNYRFLPFDEDDPGAVFYESANNISNASKHSMASCMAKSYAKPDGWAVPWIDEWRERLIKAIENETQPFAPHSLAAKCMALGFTADMSGEELCYLLVDLHEYHEQKLIEFVYYDERIYQYCIGGKTNQTKTGKSISGGAVGGPAKAQDWYDFATVNMLFKY